MRRQLGFLLALGLALIPISCSSHCDRGSHGERQNDGSQLSQIDRRIEAIERIIHERILRDRHEQNGDGNRHGRDRDHQSRHDDDEQHQVSEVMHAEIREFRRHIEELEERLRDANRRLEKNEGARSNERRGQPRNEPRRRRTN